MGLVVGLVLALALLSAGGGLAIHLFVHFRKLEWTPAPQMVAAAFERGRRDREAGQAFDPSVFAVVSMILANAYHRGFALETHRIEMARAQNALDERTMEVDGSRAEGLRLLHELHMMDLPTNLNEATLGRVVYLLGRELRAARARALMEESSADAAFGPMSQRTSAPPSASPSSVAESSPQIH